MSLQISSDVGWDKPALRRWPTLCDAAPPDGGPAPKAAGPSRRDLRRHPRRLYAHKPNKPASPRKSCRAPPISIHGPWKDSWELLWLALSSNCCIATCHVSCPTFNNSLTIGLKRERRRASSGTMRHPGSTCSLDEFTAVLQLFSAGLPSSIRESFRNCWNEDQ